MQKKTKETTQRKNVIKDKAKRINLKSKRTRTLLRKAIEVSQMCDLDIHITMQDREFNKVIEYNSLNADGHVFCIEAVNALIEQFRDQMNSKYYKIYTDDDYESLKVQPRGGEYMDDESIE